MAMQAVKRYLVTANAALETIHMNLPLECHASVADGDNMFTLTSNMIPSDDSGIVLRQQLALIGIMEPDAEAYVAVHIPDWADDLFFEDDGGNPIPAVRDGDYWRTGRKIASGECVYVSYAGGLVLENRQCTRLDIKRIGDSITDAVLRYGPSVLTLKGRAEAPVLLMEKSEDGTSIKVPHRFRARALKQEQMIGRTPDAFIDRAQTVQLAPQGAMSDHRESVFVFDLNFWGL